jgi:pimeloyl-ACP methyl ester carboxylesterase/DNA-binding CsgD family transcriptional regulator
VTGERVGARVRELEQQVRYCATASGPWVAYATVGRGPALLVPPGWIGHLELAWQEPLVRAFYTPLARHRTVVRYDRPGCGLSDPSPDPPSLEADLQVLEGMVDHLGLDRLDLLGISTGAPTSIAFATRHPDRVGRLVLYGGFANGQGMGPAEARAAMMDLIGAHWGLGSDVLADLFVPDADAERRAAFARLQRESASPEVARQMLALTFLLRVDDLLDRVTVPTLVIHRREDRAVPYRCGRELAARIPGARLVSLEGRPHFPYDGQAEPIVRAILGFLGAPPPSSLPGRLTARQLEVAGLVAEGCSNRQIAERLGIEERSAEGHVERIRQRLGFSSRTQIAAWWAHSTS